MAEAIVHDWIAEYRTLRSAEIHSFGCTITQNNDLIQAIFTILEEKRHHEEFLEPVCHQFFSFYRSREESLQNFARQYIPCLIGVYLSSVAKGNRKSVRCVEIVLLGIYNLEVIDSSGKSSCLSFRIPLLSKPSIYHEPMSLSHNVLSERALSKLEYAETRSIKIGPHSEVEKINASNRLYVMSVLMWLYNLHIGAVSTFSLMSVCRTSSRIVKQGFTRTNRPNYGSDSSNYNSPHPRPIARIPMSSALLLEMVHAVYFAMFNGVASVGLQTLDELHTRAMQEMLSEVLLVTNAIRHSLKMNPSGQPCDGPMGISIALSPTTVVSTVTRAITNASFRAKKLPDDIPIQEKENSEHHPLLTSINEESEEPESNQPSAQRKKHSGLTTNITKVGVLQLRKGKDKRKDRDQSNGDTVDARINGKDGPTVSNSDEDLKVCFTNGDSIPMSNSFPGRIDLQLNKSGIGIDENFEFKESVINAKYVSHSRQGSDVVITSDGSCVLKSVLHKSESSNGLQSSALQTAV